MIWAVETDDFKGINGNAYPILSAIKSAYVSNWTFYVISKIRFIWINFSKYSQKTNSYF